MFGCRAIARRRQDNMCSTVAHLCRYGNRRMQSVVPGLVTEVSGISSYASPKRVCWIHWPHSPWNHTYSAVTAAAGVRWYTKTSTSCASGVSGRKPKVKIHIQGDRYGSREYIFLPTAISTDNADGTDAETMNMIRKYRIASIRANRNVLFGAKCFSERDDVDLVKACKPLVKAALVDAGDHGEQPQALAALDGLCDWVRECLENNGKGSKELELVVKEIEDSNSEEAAILLEAVKAIATGKPRPGHRVLGAGTYRDARPLWKKLAMEYAGGSGGEGCAKEAELYRESGMELVDIEHLADTSTEYLRTAGGAMARFFFV